MPGIVVPSRRSRSALDDDDDADSQTEPGTAAHSSGDEEPQRPNSHGKRQRLSSNSDDEDDIVARRTTRDSWHLDTPQTALRPARPQSRHSPLPLRDSGVSLSDQQSGTPLEHQPGSIVRISLTNFVTYSSASFHPGPALNMVIGPNGTGKSTLVCAICLGLGWATHHLGRAKEVHEFVKHDRSEAFIEIELKGHPGKRNPVIKRQINKDNSSKWWLNGQSTNQKTVNSLARSFNIQVDNLCQFLPQDRVVEFAALSPVDRLTQTMQATAPEHVIDSHNQLKALRVEQRSLEKDQANAKDQLANLEGRQNLQQADVDRIRERERLVGEIDQLEKLRPLAEYNAAKFKTTQAKERENAAKADLKELKDELEPSLRAANSKQEYANKVKEVVDRRKGLVVNLEKQAEDCHKKKQDLAQKMKTCEQKREAERSSGKNDKAKIIELQRKIQSIKTAMENAPPAFDPAEYNEQRREKTRQIREIQSNITELEDASRSLTVEIEQKQQRKKNAEKEALELRSRAGQQMAILKERSRDTYEAWEWIQKNQEQLEGKVYGPPLVECSVNNEHFVNAIESLFQKTEFCAITCTNDNDFKFLSDHLGQLKLADISLRNQRSTLSSYRPPVNDQEKERLGITGWALDYLTGPDEVLAMLCDERCRLNRTAVIERDIGEEQFNLLEKSPVDSWVTRSASYRIIRRKEYGASTTAVNQIRPAQVWAEKQVDSRHEGDLRDDIDGWQSELAELEQKKKANKQQHEKLRSQEQLLRKEETDLEKEKADLQKKLSDFKALPNKLRDHEDRLSALQTAGKELSERLEQITLEESAYALEKGQAAINYSRIVETLRTMHVQLVEAAVAYVEASSDVVTLTARNQSVKDLLAAKEKEVHEATEDHKSKHAEARKLSKTFQSSLDRNPDLVAYLNGLSEEERDRTPEEISLAIESLNARLSVIHGGSAGVIKEFEERAKRIEKLRSSLSALEEKLGSLSTSIDEIRSTWEPELDSLVARISEAFSASFEKINCAGEVEVYKDGEGGRDFESWAMNIKVKFREEEGLSVLDSHRQSGGERAVTTIFYLMALQSLSRAPFRVVDEINQGMDPRNERIVHHRMVDIACGVQQPDGGSHDHGSQYFLITPKLLTNLKYSPGMKIHCIVSGEYMPTDPAQLDFKKLVTRAKRMLESQPAAAAAAGSSER